MPGRNCCIPGCTTSEYHLHENIKFFQVPTRKSTYSDYDGWRKEIFNIISKYRSMTMHEKERFYAGKYHICSLHYSKEDVEITGKGKLSLKFGALPTMNLPIKSHQSTPAPERRVLTVVKDAITEPKSSTCYKNFLDFTKRAEKLKLSNWSVVSSVNSVIFKKFEDCMIPYIEIIVKDDLSFTILVYGWSLPSDSKIYVDQNRSLMSVTISALIKDIETNYMFCEGIQRNNFNLFMEHYLPYSHTNSVEDGVPINGKKLYRSKRCCLLSEKKSLNKCIHCVTDEKKELKDEKNKLKKINTPAHKNAPLSKTSHKRLELTIKESRQKLKAVMKEVEQKGVSMDNETSVDFYSIMENADIENPFIKLFWEEQKKIACGNPHAIKFHPMIIRFCISLASKSPAAYDELRESGILTLPSRRTLRDYTNYIKPSVGFNPQVTNELVRQSSLLTGTQRLICLSFDEIKIQETLVFDKYTGKLVGFVDLGDTEFNEITFKNNDKLASHVMLFYVRSLACDFRYSFAYFATDGMSTYQLFSLFWEGVSILETICNLKVICATSDGASVNRKFIKCHEYMDNSLKRVVYRAENIMADDERYLYFFSDVPHLIKTARNCLHHSSSSGSRNMMNADGCIMWSHIYRLVCDDLNRHTRKLPKLSVDHINLSSYSVMNVRLAAQVLSTSVANLLIKDYPDTAATARYCQYFDTFFDCLNVRSLDEGYHKRKPFLGPYRSPSDPRLQWLENDFLKYLQDWEEFTKNLQGEYSSKERSKFFISGQTYEGILITVHSFIETVRFLLSNGMDFFLSEKLNQDCTEAHFGLQRRCRGTVSNPTLQQFGYNENKLRIQKYVKPSSTGNTTSFSKKRTWFDVDDETLPKRVGGKGLF